ncbi:MAG TPA: ammonium transporter [Anaerolineae bacterium]|nr:ammonium transporter [Anaerolineae bacterium]
MPEEQLELFAGFQQAFLVGWAPVSIFIMATAGFALLYAGMVRKKNVSHMIIMINVGWTLAFLMYFLIGFPLAYYTDAPVIGLPKFLPTIANPLPPALSASGAYGIPASPSGYGDLALWFKMAMFAITAVAIVPGGMAERDHFWGWIIAAAIISGFIYPIIEHWVWGGGWLSTLGFIDYAGSTVVHLVGGTLALMSAIVIGPRIGKFVGKAETARAFFGHSIPLSVIGAWLLVFGWFGFNIGSSTATDPQTINIELAWVSLTTAMAMAGGLFGAAITSRGHVLTSMVGLLSGAVAICSGAALMHPMAAFVTGLVVGVLTTFSVGLLENVLKIDDALACFPVHGVCGIWGALATGLFGAKALGGHPIYGLETAEWLPQIGVQLLGAVVICLTTAALGYALFWTLNKFKMLRVIRDAELFGIDIALHKTYAYPEDMQDQQWGR